MNQIVIEGCPIEYVATGATGPVIVFLHGLLMDETLWSAVVENLCTDHRCIVPTLPMGAHRQPAPPELGLSLKSLARLVEGFIDQLDLRDVVLVGNDTGGALAQLIAVSDGTRVARLVLVSCEAFDNIPPGLTGKTLFLTGRLPPALFRIVIEQLRIKPLRRLPITFGWLTKRGDRTVRLWLRPVLTDRAIRRDTIRLLRAANKERGILDEITPRLATLETPTLIAWARNDKVMPPEHGHRLAKLLANAEHIEIDNTRSLVPLDQPVELASAIRSFLKTHPTTTA